MKKNTYIAGLCVSALVLSTLAGCDKFEHSPNPNVPQTKLATTFYALAGGTMLDKYSTTNPAQELKSVSISGLQGGETILGIDYRPATGQLYGVGSTSRLYVINPETGAARMIGAGPFTPALAGNMVGFDFNPTVDRIRLVTSTGQNLRLNPETGTVAATDGSINGAAGATLTAVAYENNTAGATATDLFGIDVASDKLYRISPPNDGTLVEVGALKLNVTGNGGFDIDPVTNIGLALFEVNGKATLFTVDVETGKTQTLAKYDKSLMYTGIAIPTQPVAYAVTNANLLVFNPTNPSAAVSKPITGLATGENIVGLDFRPANGQLYAVANSSSNSRLFTINASSGAATAVATLSTPLVGSSFGVDFNPVVDRIRIVSNTGQNLRVNPADGIAIVDGSLNPGSPFVTAAAYENNFAGTTATNLYTIDSQTDKLYLQNPPNAGTQAAIGDLGVNVEASNGFDIGGTSNNAYALLTVGSATRLYVVNKSTGAATASNSYSFSSPVSGFAVGLGF
ncbi:DUF4394 domain-containing protein [Hymenobacter jejuensis]|uniref:DUF4394 domain-containing protein n=1 Tax=Hymenobacter jejuensis TaxID=2502781 RepID=A0A5B8A5E9_9BACT|nr:DUF4394 domain-containing protein [Hymenobacter jejuensis]QDA61883.1 DUF4394 domain-containing protein [Hymenobacter jejuensis]